jgi:G:T/U-mismatch repair DNA glycosylase
MSVVTGHHYANLTNHFWHCLHLSGMFLILADSMYHDNISHRVYTKTFAPLRRWYTSSAFQSRTGVYYPKPRTIMPFFSSFHFSQTHATYCSSAMQINLVNCPSTSQADLSAQEMASSVPALLFKIECFCPHVACFIGKGIWLHVKRTLNHILPKSNDGASDQNAGITLGAHSEGNMPMLEPATKTPVTAMLKDG